MKYYTVKDGTLFPVGKAYAVGERFRYADKLYRIAQAHTSQEDWRPTDLPALYTEISVEKYPDWVQPTGTQDAYALGAQVTHNNRRWKSNVDANVWKPDTYGWSEVVIDVGA